LIPVSIPVVSSLLSETLTKLRDAKSKKRTLKPALVSYVFFPISTILRRNPGSAIPDQILEKLLAVLTTLCDDWWWDMDIKVWEQIFMLCSAVVGGLENKGKDKDRAEETKEAAARCLWALLRRRLPEEDPLGSQTSATRSMDISHTFLAHSKTGPFIPIIGQTVHSLLSTASSLHLPLVRVSLNLLDLIIEDYLDDNIVTSVFPGVVSNTCKIALAVGSSKTWANGDIVASALDVLKHAILRCISDQICIKQGAVQSIDSLEDLMEFQTHSQEKSELPPAAPYTTPRTKSWLSGTTSQLHIALISLKPLISHPSPSALLALSSFATTVLEGTLLTLPQSQPLLLTPRHQCLTC
jgi:TELO2-interacting protein 1